MKTKDLTEGKVLKVINLLALPIMGSSLLQFTYNFVDMIWVGRLGSNAVASIGASSLYINLGNAVNSLVVMGTGIKVAHAAGRKDQREEKEYINSGIFMNALMGLMFAAIILGFGKNLIGFFRLDNYEVEKDAYYYLSLNAPISFLAFFNMLYTRILGSFGNNDEAFKINGCGVVLNIILDPVFIYVFKMGVMGAAISTLTANFIMFILFIRMNPVLKYDFSIKLDKQKMKEIGSLGLPMAMQRVLFTGINIILAKIIAQFGSEAIAAQKIGVQIESIAYMVFGGLNGAVAAFTGQNFGAKKYERIKEGYKEAAIIGITYGIAVASVFFLLNKPIIRIFVKDDPTILIASQYLKAVAFSQVFTAVEMVSTGLFTGIGRPKIPSIISIMFTGMRIPMAMVLIKVMGIQGIWWSISITSILKGVSNAVVYFLKAGAPIKV